MPKVVDHEVRRAEIAEALWRVVAREGIEAATIRAVAAEAGWSRGIVEHYFDSKDALVLYACELALERTLALVKQRHETLVGREALRAVLLDDLAQGKDIWFDLLSTAAREPAMAPQLVRFDSEISTILAGIIAEMVARGEASRRPGPRRRGTCHLRLQSESQHERAHEARALHRRGRRGRDRRLSRSPDAIAPCGGCRVASRRRPVGDACVTGCRDLFAQTAPASRTYRSRGASHASQRAGLSTMMPRKVATSTPQRAKKGGRLRARWA